MASEQAEIVAQDEDSIDICVGITEWQEEHGYYFVEKDFPVNGEIWRVHKSDPDPFPSSPHAHCVDGRERFKGCKLHLGTGELYRDGKPTGRRLKKKQFNQLCGLLRRAAKF